MRGTIWLLRHGFPTESWFNKFGIFSGALFREIAHLIASIVAAKIESIMTASKMVNFLKIALMINLLLTEQSLLTSRFEYSHHWLILLHNRILNRGSSLHSNKALWMDNGSHVTSFNQSGCFISMYYHSSYAMLKFVYVIKYWNGRKRFTTYNLAIFYLPR